MTGVRLGMLSHTLHADTPCMQTWSGVHRNGTNGFMYDRQPPGESRSRCPCVAVDVGEAKATIGNEAVQYPADIEQGKCSAWDAKTHPACKHNEDWCTQRWCTWKQV